MQEVTFFIKRKKFVKKAGLMFIIILIFLTFFSKTINNALLPEVEVNGASSGYIIKEIFAKGKIKASNILEISSYGNWRLNDVKTKVGAQIKKDDVLAIIDTEDYALLIKAKELEIFKLNQEIRSLQNNIQSNENPLLEAELNKDAINIERQEDKLNIARKLHEAGAEIDSNIKDLENKLLDLKKEYEIKQIMNKQKLEEYERNRGENAQAAELKKVELDYRKQELKILKDRIPEDGLLKSDVEGIIKAVNVHKGSLTNTGQVLFVINERSDEIKVLWEMNENIGRDFHEGDKVQYYINGQVGKTIEGKIQEKIFIPDKSVFEFSSSLSVGNEQFQDGQEIEVYAIKKGVKYNYLISNSSLIKSPEGKDCIYVVKKRKGALGEENFVEAIDVSVLESDDFNSAIDTRNKLDNASIVVYTTKILQDGMQVKVK